MFSESPRILELGGSPSMFCHCRSYQNGNNHPPTLPKVILCSWSTTTRSLSSGRWAVFKSFSPEMMDTSEWLRSRQLREFSVETSGSLDGSLSTTTSTFLEDMEWKFLLVIWWADYVGARMGTATLLVAPASDADNFPRTGGCYHQAIESSIQNFCISPFFLNSPLSSFFEPSAY